MSSSGSPPVEQRGEEVIRISINKGDVDAAHLREFACAAQAAKSSSDDDNPMLRHLWSLVRFTGTACCLNLAPDPAPLPENSIVTQLTGASPEFHCRAGKIAMNDDAAISLRCPRSASDAFGHGWN